MSHCFANNNAGHLFASTPTIVASSFRWHSCGRPGVYDVTTRKAATDEGKPAELVRTFDAVVDDFGTLVEVPA